MEKIIKNIRKMMMFLPLILTIFSLNQAFAGDETALFTSGSAMKANVLLILDNSNSMDENFQGDSICAWQTGSRLVEGKRTLRDIVSNYVNTMRIGLMSFSLSGVNDFVLHNSPYFVSYDPKSYCPKPPSACQDYCSNHGNTAARTTCSATCLTQNSAFDVDFHRTDDPILYPPGSTADSAKRISYCQLIFPKTNRMTNPTDTSNYIYYKLPGTFYNGSNAGTRFAYSDGYSTGDYNTDGTINSYSIYTTKTGTNDNNANYSGGAGGGGFVPTDEDYAQGFYNFGQRMYWKYSGRVWYANSSPGGGYLHVPIADNPTTGGSTDSQKNALLAKLDMTEGDESGYMTCSSTGNACPHIIAAGLTPTAGTFQSAINYFNGVSPYSGSSPIQDWCQKNYIVYVTDGLPSVAENGTTGTAAALTPAVLAKIDALRNNITKTISGKSYNFDVQTYVLGMAITDVSKPYLDSMAVHGGTSVDGSAYYADDAGALTTKLNNIFADIIEKSCSFATASVSASRTVDENYIYEASFEPVNLDPFWRGHLQKYNINSDGTIGSMIWDAGDVLKGTSDTARRIFTMIGGTTTEFTTSIDKAYFGVSTDTLRNNVVNYIRGKSGSDGYNIDNWKLGDIFHSTPVSIGTPSPYFVDTLDFNNAFAVYRDGDSTHASHKRVSNCGDGTTTCDGYGRRSIVTGSNDGQIRLFRATDGLEGWSFIPPNVLPKLQYIAHNVHPPALTTHHYFVDGPINIADVWLGSGSGTTKLSTDWKTIGIISLGRNDRDYTKNYMTESTKLWSTSTNCDTGLGDTYDPTAGVLRTYYCGYYAFDFTNSVPGSTDPAFMWHLNPSAANAPYLSEPWSKMAIGRVKINGNEKWVGMMGGGFYPASCTGSGCDDNRGRGFYVVDLSNGNILWSYNRSTNSDMQYAIVATPALVDTDSDGFVDAAYVGDNFGNMWQFQFCKSASSSTCGTNNWQGSLLLDKVGNSDKQPVYSQATVAKDGDGNIWLYWGTGDRSDPTGNDPASYVFGLKPLRCINSTTGAPQACLRSNLSNITAAGNTYCSTTDNWGWYINLTGKQEKMLADPVAFGKYLYFTTYQPGSSGTCNMAGQGFLYAINIDARYGTCNVGAGGFAGGARDVFVGYGIPSSPIISLKPGGALPVDLYVTTSGGGGIDSSTIRVDFNPPTLSNRTNMLFWRDRRVQ